MAKKKIISLNEKDDFESQSNINSEGLVSSEQESTLTDSSDHFYDDLINLIQEKGTESNLENVCKNNEERENICIPEQRSINFYDEIDSISDKYINSKKSSSIYETDNSENLNLSNFSKEETGDSKAKENESNINEDLKDIHSNNSFSLHHLSLNNETYSNNQTYLNEGSEENIILSADTNDQNLSNQHYLFYKIYSFIQNIVQKIKNSCSLISEKLYFPLNLIPIFIFLLLKKSVICVSISFSSTFYKEKWKKIILFLISFVNLFRAKSFSLIENSKKDSMLDLAISRAPNRQIPKKEVFYILVEDVKKWAEDEFDETECEIRDIDEGNEQHNTDESIHQQHTVEINIQQGIKEENIQQDIKEENNQQNTNEAVQQQDMNESIQQQNKENIHKQDSLSTNQKSRKIFDIKAFISSVEKIDFSKNLFIFNYKDSRKKLVGFYEKGMKKIFKSDSNESNEVEFHSEKIKNLALRISVKKPLILFLNQSRNFILYKKKFYPLKFQNFNTQIQMIGIFLPIKYAFYLQHNYDSTHILSEKDVNILLSNYFGDELEVYFF